MAVQSKDEILRVDSDLQHQPCLVEALLPALRITANDFHSYLEHVACNVSISDTKTQAHCYFITLDGNKRPRVKDFARFIKNRIVDFAIPRFLVFVVDQQPDISSVRKKWGDARKYLLDFCGIFDYTFTIENMGKFLHIVSVARFCMQWIKSSGGGSINSDFLRPKTIPVAIGAQS